MSQLEAIDWPDETKIVSLSRKSATVNYIQNLFYNTGLVTSVIYLALKLILVPALAEQCCQRVDLSGVVILRLRKLVSKLQNSLRTARVSALAYNECATTVERCTQTSEDTLDETESHWMAINKRIGDAGLHIRQFTASNASPPQQMDAFNAEARLLADRLKDEIDADSSSGVSKNVVDSVREVKGWIVSGRVY